MNFGELREHLAELATDPRYTRAKPNGIWYDVYDAGKGIPGEDKWHLRQDGDQYLVSWLERGEFHFTQAFSTEDAACEWLWEQMSTIPPPPVRIPEEEIQAIGEAMRTRYAGDLKDWRRWPDDQSESKATPWYRRGGRKRDDS